MNFKKVIALSAALGMTASAFTGFTTPAFAEDTETVYNCSELLDAEYKKTGADVFGGAIHLTANEKIVPQAVNATIVSPLGNTVTVTSALKSKQIASKLTLNAGETVVAYYCGSDSGAANPKALDMVVKDSTGTVVATESNAENKGGSVKPYTISYTATTTGEYTIVDNGTTTNRTILYAIATTSGTYNPSVTPGPDVTADPNVTPDPDATPVPTSTPKPTVDPDAKSEVKIERAAGWLETAYVMWTNSVPVDKYNVYVKPEGGEYTKIDDELVRYYGSYYRADALGLKAGRYQLKVAAVLGGVEMDEHETEVLEVKAHTREGYSFDPKSPNYNPEGIGGYKYDGTVKDNAQIIYITDKNKDTVKHTVMVNGKPNEGVGLVDILALREKNKSETTPLIIRMIGQVDSPAGKNSAGYIQIKATENVTFEGVGDDATTYHWSFLLRDTKNVEVRNLAVMEFYDDGISLDTDNFNDWIHNCDIFYGQNRGGDQKKGDGSLDVKSGSTYVTVSFNHFWDSGKSAMCGMNQDEGTNFTVTYHHNWFDHSDSRHPRVRAGTIHIYNNYYDGVSKYGAGATTASSLFVESNYFRNTAHPVLTSMQGTDINNSEGKGTFSKEDGGMIKMYGNILIGGGKVVNAKDEPVEFDAYIADTRDEKVPSTYKAKQGGGTYNNFDTSADMYAYTAETADKAVATVMKYAGRVEGGDFRHTFNNDVDDPSYDRDPVLGGELEKYRTTMVASYTEALEYPATDGTVPGVRPEQTPVPYETPDPNVTPDPNATPVPQVKTDIWRASDTGANVAADTSLKSWLTLVGGAAEYKASNKSIDGIALSGRLAGPSSQSKPTLAANGQDGASLKVSAAANGQVKVYFKLNAGKTIYITDAAGAVVVSKENTSAESVYTSLSADIAKDGTYYIFAEGSNAEFWAVEYTTTGSYEDPGDDDPTPIPTTEPSTNPTTKPTNQPTTEPSNPPATAQPGKCVKITAEYSADGRLISVKTEEASTADAVPSVNGTTKVMYWDTLGSMKPVTAGSTEPEATKEPIATADPSSGGDIIWKASESVAANTELAPGLSVMFDATYTGFIEKDDTTLVETPTTKVIGGVEFNGYLSHPSMNGSWSGTSVDPAKSTVLKYTASTNGVLTVYFDTVASNKLICVGQDGMKKGEIESAGTFGPDEPVAHQIQVKAGQTYYVYISGSKGRFCGAAFTSNGTAATPQPTTNPTTEPTDPPAVEPITAQTTSRTWSFNASNYAPYAAMTKDSNDRDIATISRTVAYDNIEVTASADKTVVIDYSKKTFGATEYLGRLKFGGRGSKTLRVVKFIPGADGTVEVDALHSSSDATQEARDIMVVQGSTETPVSLKAGADPVRSAAINVVANEPVYIYGAASVNLYGVIYTVK